MWGRVSPFHARPGDVSERSFTQPKLFSHLRYVYKYFVSCLFTFLIVSFEIKAFHFDEVQFIYFFLSSLVILVSYLRNHCQI